MVFAVSLTPPDGPIIVLGEGATILGRGTTFGIQDRRVSRKHAQLFVSHDAQTVTLMSLGINPTFLHRFQSSKIEHMSKDQVEVLHDNDKISLVNDKGEFKLSFKIHIEEDEDEVEEGSTDGDGVDADATQQIDSQDLKSTFSPVKRAREITKEGIRKSKKLRSSRNQGSESEDSSLSDGLHSAMKGGAKIDYDELEFIRTIGVGSCGEVWEATWKETQVAVKKVFRALLHGDALKEFKAEATMLRRLRHPNVVLFMGTCERKNELMIVTEFMPRGSLRDVLDDDSVDIDWPLLLKMATDAAQGMNYLHKFSPPIIHRDLKSQNLLVDYGFTVKVTDFGLAKFQEDDITNTFCGTLPWTSPEIFNGKGYTNKADVYSYGIVLWEMITREEPYKGVHKPVIIVGVTRENLRPEIPESCPSEFATLIRSCWTENPDDRPPFSEVLKILRAMQGPRTSRDLGNIGSGASPLVLTQKFRRSALTHTYDSGQGWAIDAEELEFQEEIGSGASAHVYKGLYRGQPVAIKVLKGSLDTKSLTEFKKEFAIMSEIRSPSVVFFYGAAVHPDLCIVTELLSRGSLYDLMKDESIVFTYPMICRLAIKAALAVNSLHCWKPPIVHRDLKSPNLLVDENWIVKVADFGLARFKTAGNEGTLGQLRGTYAYAAPETYLGQQYSTKSDVFSFGIVIWELVMRVITSTYHRPYSEYKNLRFDFQIIVQTAKKGLRPSISADCPDSFRTLISQCWDENPDNRPSIKDVIATLRAIEDEFAEMTGGGEIEEQILSAPTGPIPEDEHIIMNTSKDVYEDSEHMEEDKQNEENKEDVESCEPGDTEEEEDAADAVQKEEKGGEKENEEEENEEEEEEEEEKTEEEEEEEKEKEKEEKENQQEEEDDEKTEEPEEEKEEEEKEEEEKEEEEKEEEEKEEEEKEEELKITEDNVSKNTQNKRATKRSNSRRKLTRTTSKSRTSARDKCRYGKSCYRKNPDHLRKYAHPGDDDWS